MTDLNKMAESAKKAAYELEFSESRNEALLAIADALEENTESIIRANTIDIENAKKNGIRESMIDRLKLTPDRIKGIAEGVRKVAGLEDIIGNINYTNIRPNGLEIREKIVPLGVVAIIYEARPNVTVDAAALCLKTANSVILRGGKEAIESNLELMRIMKDAAEKCGIPSGALNIIEDTSRETTIELMKLKGYIDVLIPRGGKGLIKSVVENATVPVIETAAGNCHTYIEKSADLNMAEKIILNAKVSRPSVCNACETVLIDREFAGIDKIIEALQKEKVEIRAEKEIAEKFDGVKLADEEDWYTEYNDYIISLKLVSGIEEAVTHINKYNTKHSEAIITNNSEKAQYFLDRVDASSVYVNASTRFTDGFEFGYGAEIGISTQKLHARGPMGMKALTSVKYIICGSGQVRI